MRNPVRRYLAIRRRARAAAFQGKGLEGLKPRQLEKMKRRITRDLMTAGIFDEEEK